MRRAKDFLLRGAFAFGGKLERHLAVSPDNDKPMPWVWAASRGRRGTRATGPSCFAYRSGVSFRQPGEPKSGRSFYTEEPDEEV